MVTHSVRTHARRASLLVAALALVPACVGKSTYEAAVHDADSAKKQSDRVAADNLRLRKELEDGRLAALDREAKVTHDKNACDKRLEEEVAKTGELRAELEKSGKDVDALLKAHAAEKARAALYKEISQKFKKMVDAGDLAITLREGRMVLQLPNDVLFASGKADLEPAGKATLEKVAIVLRTIDRRFQVAGHTDDEPIKLSPFASNWELSTVRALVVTNFLVKHGVNAPNLSAAGYGEFDPVAPNDGPKNRAKNRRIEITVQPRIDELVSVPQ